MFGGGRYGGYGVYGSYGGMGRRIGGDGGRLGYGSSSYDVMNEAAGMLGAPRMGRYMGMPNMTSFGGGTVDAQMDRMIADCDPMAMGDRRRGAEWLIRQGGAGQAARILHALHDPQTAAMLIRLMQARCIAILGEPGRENFEIPYGMDCAMGYGMAGGVPGGMAGRDFPRARPGVEDWMGNLPEGSHRAGAMTSRGGSNSAVRGSSPRADLASFRARDFDEDVEEFEGSHRRSGWRRLFGGGRSRPATGGAGGGAGGSGSRMYGAFVGVGRL